jgi:acetolactate synthase-1/2/3 large subunit
MRPRSPAWISHADKPRHGGHLAAAALTAEGVTHLFTLSGGHIAPIYDGCVDEGIRIVDFRHEQAAAHAADGWARVTGRPGVAAVTAGPGVTDSVTGIANAMYANSPILVFGGKSPLGELEMGSLQDMDHVTLVRSITKWARTCWATGRIADYVTEAFRHATTGRKGPVFLDIPLDVQFNAWPAGLEVPEDYRTEAQPLGAPDLVKEAVRILGEAEHPVVLAGAGVRWSEAHQALAALAGALKVPVFLNSLGRGCLPPDHPSLFLRGPEVRPSEVRRRAGPRRGLGLPTGVRATAPRGRSGDPGGRGRSPHRTEPAHRRGDRR